MPPQDTTRFEDLLRRVLDGQVDGLDEMPRIGNAIAKDAALRREYLDQIELDALLSWELGDHLNSESQLSIAASSPFEPPTQSRSWLQGSPAALAAAAAIPLFLGIGYFLGHEHSNHLEAPAPAAVAVLIDSEDCVLADTTRRPLSFGSRFPQGETLHIRSGIARLAMQNQAGVTIEGPSEIELVSREEVRVMFGNVSAYAPEEAIGFKLITPDVEIVDLGTHFAASVQRDGTTDVHVFEGEISVQGRQPSNANPAEERVIAGEARRYGAGGAPSAAIAIAPEKFAAPPALEQLLSAGTARPGNQESRPPKVLEESPVIDFNLLAAQNFHNSEGALHGSLGGAGFSNQPWRANPRFTRLIPTVASHSGSSKAGGYLLVRGRDKAEPFVANRMNRLLREPVSGDFYFAIRASYHGLDEDDFFSLWIDTNGREGASHANVPTLGIREGRYFARVDIEHAAFGSNVVDGEIVVLAGHYVWNAALNRTEMSLWINPNPGEEPEPSAVSFGPIEKSEPQQFRFVGLRMGQFTEVSDRLLIHGLALGRTLEATLKAISD